jgi:hypothetical protein
MHLRQYYCNTLQAYNATWRDIIGRTKPDRCFLELLTTWINPHSSSAVNICTKTQQCACMITFRSYSEQHSHSDKVLSWSAAPEEMLDNIIIVILYNQLYFLFPKSSREQKEIKRNIFLFTTDQVQQRRNGMNLLLSLSHVWFLTGWILFPW